MIGPQAQLVLLFLHLSLVPALAREEDTMDADTLIHTLHVNPEAIRALVGVSKEHARWRPSDRKWSILEVINHLYDEEREDFRTRLDITLHQPEATWPPIDPEGWVHERDYQNRDPAQSLDGFLAEREESVRWLHGLSTPVWNTIRDRPGGGTLSAGDLLASWVAHDFLHLRQLVRLHYVYAVVAAEPYSVRYAGQW